MTLAPTPFGRAVLAAASDFAVAGLCLFALVRPSSAAPVQEQALSWPLIEFLALMISSFVPIGMEQIRELQARSRQDAARLGMALVVLWMAAPVALASIPFALAQGLGGVVALWVLCFNRVAPVVLGRSSPGARAEWVATGLLGLGLFFLSAFVMLLGAEILWPETGNRERSLAMGTIYFGLWGLVEITGPRRRARKRRELEVWQKRREAYAAEHLPPFTAAVAKAWDAFPDKGAEAWEAAIDRAEWPTIHPNMALEDWREFWWNRLGPAEQKVVHFCETLYPPASPGRPSVPASPSPLAHHQQSILAFFNEMGAAMKHAKMWPVAASEIFEPDYRIAKLMLYLEIARAGALGARGPSGIDGLARLGVAWRED